MNQLFLYEVHQEPNYFIAINLTRIAALIRAPRSETVGTLSQIANELRSSHNFDSYIKSKIARVYNYQSFHRFSSKKKRQVIRKRMQIVSLLFEGDIDRAAVEMQSTILKNKELYNYKNFYQFGRSKYSDFYKRGSRRPGTGKRITKA